MTTIERFNKLRWHDSRLLSLSFYRSADEDRIRLSLELYGEDGSLKPAEIVFEECAYMAADVYLAAKSLCADAISGAKCYETSSWKAAVSEPSPYDPIQGDRGFERFLHFSIGMIAPGGTIELLARDFKLLEPSKGEDNGMVA